MIWYLNGIPPIKQPRGLLIQGWHYTTQVTDSTVCRLHGQNTLIPPHVYFSRMRSKGSRFTLGVWGLRVCALDVAQPFATVRSRPQPSAWGPYGRAYGKFCKRGHFWRFETLRCFVSHGRRDTSWRSDVCRNMWKVVLCGRRNTFRRCVAVFVAGAELWTCPSSFCVAGAALWTCRVAFFCGSHCQGCVKWRQGANSVAGSSFCEMWWKLTEVPHETSILR